MTTCKPFLKWVGGKTQILDNVLGKFPTTIENYYEPFLGGGSVLLGLLSAVKERSICVKGRVYASDLNADLIHLYKTLQSSPEPFLRELGEITREFTGITGTVVNRDASNLEEAKTSRESYYYWIRKQYNALRGEERTSIQAACMFLFLNKTCFRGVYRVGPHGFNVPFGHYKNPSIYDEAHIRAVSELVRDVIFRFTPWQEAIVSVQKGDFVYLDPPYAPETSKSFVGYTADGFTLDAHKQLFLSCKQFQEAKIGFLMSNAAVDLVRESFPAEKFTTDTIVCRRAIHSKDPSAVTNEVLIRPNI